MIRRGDRPVDAAVRLEALNLGVAFERWQSKYARLAVFVLDRLEDIELALDDRPAEREPRRPRLEASELARAPPGPRLEIVHRDVPRITRPLCRDCRHPSR